MENTLEETIQQAYREAKSTPEDLKFFKKFIVETYIPFKKFKAIIFKEINPEKTAQENFNYLNNAIRKINDAQIKQAAKINEEWTAEQKLTSINLMQVIYEAMISFCEKWIKKYETILKRENFYPESIGNQKTQKDKFSHKKQILLLSQIGFFGLSQIKNLSIVKKGQLISHLLNRDEKNSSDYIRYFDGKNILSKHNCKTPENIQAVNELLENLGLKEIYQNVKELA